MKKLYTILLMSTICSTVPAFAGTVLYEGTVITFDDKYSFKDYTQRNLLDAKDLEGKVIYASVFSQETPDTKVFPESVKSMTFYQCNLDNVKINKPDWTTIGGSQRRYQVQNDLRDWEVDGTGKPLKVLNEENWKAQGDSVDPVDIPLTKLDDTDKIKKVKLIDAVIQ